MYDFYIVKASSDAAENVELRQAGKDAPLGHVAVSAYGSLEMRVEGVHLVLKNLKKPLAVGDKIRLAFVTDAGVQMSAEATVK
jgi:copper(I)-binding protein